MKFADIPGHKEVKETLRKIADSGRIPHALLLGGPSGIGKFALARAFAQYINCRDRRDGDSCGSCPSCIRHQAFTDIDTHFVFPVVKREKDTRAPVSDDFIDSWKEYLEGRVHMDFSEWTRQLDKKNAQPVTYVTESEDLMHKLSFASRVSKYKIVLWWLPEKMNVEAANKLLKLIEEPYEDTIFIMVSDNPKQIIETIYSRLQRINVRPLSDKLIAEELESRYALDNADAMMIAHNATGSMSDAIRALDNRNTDTQYLELFISLMRLAYQRKVADLREWANDLASLGRESEAGFYDFATRLIRENFIFNFGESRLSYLNNKERDFSRNFARFITVNNVEKLIEVFDKAKTDILGNGNGKIVNFDVAIRVILLLKRQ